ncbi:MAG TPA: hypothetical protein PK472_06110 [Pseudomonadota bacterium]|nr:hypothetical protein [Pseudomonadota bacterium]HND13171.1 hypothetical protein [Pseudomonadota bacterium]
MRSRLLPRWFLPPLLGISLALLAGCNRGPKPAPPKTPSAITTAGPSALTSPDADLRACCKQCIDTSSRDPAGFDIAIRRCTDYRGDFRGEPGVDERCTKILAQNQSTVRSCQTLLHAP